MTDCINTATNFVEKQFERGVLPYSNLPNAFVPHSQLVPAAPNRRLDALLAHRSTADFEFLVKGRSEGCDS